MLHRYLLKYPLASASSFQILAVIPSAAFFQTLAAWRGAFLQLQLYEFFLSLVTAPRAGVCGSRWVPMWVGWWMCSVGWPCAILPMCIPAPDEPSNPAWCAEATVLPPDHPSSSAWDLLLCYFGFPETDISSLTLHVFLSGRMCIFCWYELIFECLPFPYGVVSFIPFGVCSSSHWSQLGVLPLPSSRAAVSLQSTDTSSTLSKLTLLKLNIDTELYILVVNPPLTPWMLLLLEERLLWRSPLILM